MSNHQILFKEKIRLLLFIIFLSFIISFFIFVPKISLPFAIGYIIYIIINPIIPYMEKRGMSRTITVSIILLILLFFVIYPIVRIVPAIVEEAKNFQYYVPKIENYIIQKYSNYATSIKVHTGYEMSGNYINSIIEYIRLNTTKILFVTPQILTSILEWAFLIPVFLFFILKDLIKFRFFVLKLIPNIIFERFYYIIHQFNKTVRGLYFCKIY